MDEWGGIRMVTKEFKKTPIENRERILPVQGAYNVRDLGGYQTGDGKTVCWGKIFRSGDLDKLTKDDLEYFNRLSIRTYIDFRESTEIAAAPDKTPSSLLHAYNLSIDAGNMIDMHTFSAEHPEEIMEEINRLLVKSFQHIYREFFEILADTSNIPLLFHCTAGKDRTGFAAALFLSALGVDRETIIEDYMLSAGALEEKYAIEIERYPQLTPFMTVRRSYIEAAFDVIDRDFGGMENYLTRNLGIDTVQMKAMYTE